MRNTVLVINVRTDGKAAFFIESGQMRLCTDNNAPCPEMPVYRLNGGSHQRIAQFLPAELRIDHHPADSCRCRAVFRRKNTAAGHDFTVLFRPNVQRREVGAVRIEITAGLFNHKYRAAQRQQAVECLRGEVMQGSCLPVNRCHVSVRQ